MWANISCLLCLVVALYYRFIAPWILCRFQPLNFIWLHGTFVPYRFVLYMVNLESPNLLLLLLLLLISICYTWLLMFFSWLFLGPAPNVDIVLSICLQSDVPVGKTGKSGTTQTPMLSGPATSDLSGSSRSRPVPSGSSFKTRDRQSGKRKDRDSTFMFFHSHLVETMLIAISFILVTYCMCRSLCHMPLKIYFSHYKNFHKFSPFHVLKQMKL